MNSSSRVGPAALRRIVSDLSERDRHILLTLRRYRLLSAGQLQRLCFGGLGSSASANRTTGRVLKRLHRVGLVVRLDRRVGGIRAGSTGYIYRLSSVGFRALGIKQRRRSSQPSERFVAHTLAIGELASNATDATTNSTVVELLGLEPEPYCWRDYPDGLSTATLKPDLEIRLATSEVEVAWFVEIDRATEPATTIERKCRWYLEYFHSGAEQQAAEGLFPKVLWVVPDERRRSQLDRLFQELPDRQLGLFDVVETEQALKRLMDIGKPDT